MSLKNPFNDVEKMLSLLEGDIREELLIEVASIVLKKTPNEVRADLKKKLEKREADTLKAHEKGNPAFAAAWHQFIANQDKKKG
jgi:hypothetical protein